MHGTGGAERRQNDWFAIAAYALVVQAITDHPTAAFATLAAAMLLIVPFVRGLSAEAASSGAGAVRSTRR